MQKTCTVRAKVKQRTTKAHCTPRD